MADLPIDAPRSDADADGASPAAESPSQPSPPPRRKKKRWWLRIPLYLLLVVVVFELLLNGVLNSGLISWVAAKDQPRAFKLTLQRAWSFWPSVAHVQGFLIEAQDPNLRFTVYVERADVGIDLKAFVKPAFHAKWIRARGVVFRIGQNRPNVAMVPEFGLPDLQQKGPVKPPPGPIFHILLDDMQVQDIRELWVMGLAWQGQGTARGSLKMDPLRMVNLGPSLINLEPGKLVTDEGTLLENVGGSVAMSIDPFDPLKHPGIDVLQYFTVLIGLDGDIPSVTAIKDALPKAPPMGLTGKDGHLSIRADLEKGVLTPKTKIELHAHEMRGGYRDFAASGDLEVTTQIVQNDDGLGAEVKASLMPLKLWRKGSQRALLDGDGVRLRLTVPSLELIQGKYGPPSLSVKLLPAAVAEVNQLTRQLLPKSKITPESGVGRLEGNVELSPGFKRATGKMELRIPELEADFAESTIAGDLDVKASLENFPLSGKLPAEKGTLKLSARITHLVAERNHLHFRGAFALVGERKAGDKARMTLDVSPLVVYRADSNAPILTGTGFHISANSDSAELFQGDFSNANVTAELRGLELTDFSVFNPFLPPKADFRFAGGTAALKGRAILGLGDIPGSGSVDLFADQMKMRYGALRFGGRMAMHVSLTKIDINKGQFDVGGSSIHLDRVSVEGGNAKSQQWSGGLTVRHGTLTSKPVSVQGSIHGDFSDTRPLLAVFAAIDTMPKWLGPLLQVSPLTADADVFLHEPYIDVPQFKVTGGPFVINGKIRVESGVKSGAMLVALGPLSVGLGLLGDTPQLQIADPLSWYKKQPGPTPVAPVAGP